MNKRCIFYKIKVLGNEATECQKKGSRKKKKIMHRHICFVTESQETERGKETGSARPAGGREGARNARCKRLEWISRLLWSKDKLQQWDKQGEESGMGLGLWMHPRPEGNPKYFYTY